MPDPGPHPSHLAAATADPVWLHLDERIDAAAEALQILFNDFAGAAPGRACTWLAEHVAPAVQTLTDAAAFADLHAGSPILQVARTLGLTGAEARRRYGRGPRDLPLAVVLDAGISLFTATGEGP